MFNNNNNNHTTRTTLIGAKIAIFDQCLALASMTAGPSSVVSILTVE